ncbi:MAG: hypothetical protein L3J39_12565 [Verrucomicrobiales bacterium]|nr:hypothetical protein [Verrucomicrobiales bacterium]
MSGGETGGGEHGKKMEKLSIYGSCLLLLFLFGCVSSNKPAAIADSGFRQRTHQFTSRHGEQEAAKDFANGVYAIYSANAYTLYYPGLDIEVGGAVVKKFGVRHIEGTSDTIKSSEHRDFILAAFHFASKYNRKKLELLKSSGKL